MLPLLAGAVLAPSALAQCNAGNTVVANVVAIDQPLTWNKFGSHDPYGQMYALEADIVPMVPNTTIAAGNARLRDDLRPRPLILRVNQGQCLQIHFKNLLDPNQFGDQPATRTASFHVTGLSYLNMGADAANVGTNGDSLVAPNGTATYTYVTQGVATGIHLAASLGALAGGEGDSGSMSHGMFGGVVVEPPNSTWLDSSTGASLLSGNQIVNGTAYAIIDDPASEPFREFAVLFHDEVKTFYTTPTLSLLNTEFWLHSVRDAFGINYGISGIGSLLLAGLCAPDCRYEESFLTSWANGDPALLPHFADDPSNVWHSYLGDRTKIRFMHVGPKETHIFHLHAHQWLYSENDPASGYLDSQATGPGSAFTLDIAYGGAGNRNLTAGDSIFHCHLYPHFAQGMWGLWRVHDVLEDGGRTLPDLTPIPRVAPLPGKALPPRPTADRPGYPFFIPGVAGVWNGGTLANGVLDYEPGHRPPQPPMDIEVTGGLGRHVFGNKEKANKYVGMNIGTGIAGTENNVNALGLALDAEFATGILDDQAIVAANDPLPDPTTFDVAHLPYDGTFLEQQAMAYHATAGGHPSVVWNDPAALLPAADPVTGYYVGASPATPFAVNGKAPAKGAPFADPCPGDVTRTYKGTVIDMENFVVNNTGWHDPQARFYVLDEDVAATLAGTRPTEPFFIRVESEDCVEFWHTNASKREMHADDFQVQTPTDTIGQHIHLVKFDVLSADGSANGWNYEDATFSPEELADRLDAMGLPYTAHATQTTIQRWWADPLLNAGVDRTIRTVFTHDHYAPSTIQQHGAYASVIVEPKGSTWYNSITGEQLGYGRDDGGPTFWRADIELNNGESIREFCLAVADFAVVYDENDNPINPPRNELGVITPEAISAADPGTMLMNYRNEPIPLRIGRIPATGGSALTDQLRPGKFGRIPFVFDSNTHGDPATPLMTAYQGDTVQFRLIQGAQEDSHSFMVNRLRWLREVDQPNSGWVNAQHVGISEHFEMQTDAISLQPTPSNGRNNNPNQPNAIGRNTDLLWADTSEDGLWNGVWGIFRVFANPDANDPAGKKRSRPQLRPLNDNPNGLSISNFQDFGGQWPCPQAAPVRTYNVTAVLATDVLGPNGITYNTKQGGIFDDTGLMYVLEEWLVIETDPLSPNYNQIIGTNGPIAHEPLVLRAAAGDCLKINLRNRLPSNRLDMPDNPLSDARMTPITNLNVHNLQTENEVGISIDLLHADANDGDGGNFGYNLAKSVGPGAMRALTYYCGRVEAQGSGSVKHLAAIPAEFGVCNMRSWGDVIKQNSQGLMGAVVVEPEGSTWSNDTGTSATVTSPTRGTFREFVLVQQDGLNLQQAAGAIADVGDDPEDSGEKAYNYRTEPFWMTVNNGQFMDNEDMNDVDLSNVLKFTPETPVFTAGVGESVMFRLCQPAGRARAHTFTVHGHNWRDEIDNPLGNKWGQQTAHTVGHGFNIWIESAGGPAGVAGDYLFHEMSSFQFSQGVWGILRVQ